MKYALSQLLAEFSSNDICLNYIFQNSYKHCPNCSGSTFYRIKNRPAFICRCGHQIYPLKGTIFEKSRTPLISWFYVIYLFSVSKNGVAATEIQRHLGVTYKTAWRMGHQIRKLMRSDDRILEGIVEVDETYIGGRHRKFLKYKKKFPVFGAVERGGSIRATHVKSTGVRVLLPEIYRTVKPDTQIYSDEWGAYKKLSRYGYRHDTVVHSKYEWARENVHTNTIEGFWGQLKRSLHGTHHSVSKKWLQSYVDEFVFRYNHRNEPTFHKLLSLSGCA